MKWIKTSDQLPDVDVMGESDYVLAYQGHRCIPRIVKYSDGSVSKRGWWTTSFGHITFRSGRDRHLTFTHWCRIELPKEE